MGQTLHDDSKAVAMAVSSTKMVKQSIACLHTCVEILYTLFLGYQQHKVPSWQVNKRTAVQHHNSKSSEVVNKSTAYNRHSSGGQTTNSGGPSRVSYGQSTHTYGTVSKASLKALQQRQW
jgi:hypothetical protein